MVVGCGTIGQLTIKLLGIMGCGSITAVDIDSGKLKMALNNGANYTINSREEDINSRILELTSGEGIDIAFEAVGISETVGYTIKSLKKGGEVTLLGNIQTNIEFPLQFAVTNEISINTSCASAGEYATCLKLINANKIDLKDIIGLTAPLSEGAAVFDKLRKGSGIIKAVLLP
jgi:L-iditol 2-dehydrogenase